MGKYVAENIVKGLIKMDKTIRGSKVAVLGFTFKENCQDTRNTKVISIIDELHDYGIQTVVVDDVADWDEAKRLYGIDIVAVCVQHDLYKSLTLQKFDQMYRDSKKIIFDLKGMYDKDEFIKAGYFYWRL